jgi:uncharacterized RDD family membrane protein YckC
VNERRVRVPLEGWNTEERRRLRALAAGAQIDIRWEGDVAVLVAADDEARVLDLVTSIHAAAGSEPSIAPVVPPMSNAPVTLVTPVTPVPSTAAASPAMWAIDPTGRHEYRYWSGAMWTAHVADHGIQAADPLTEVPPLTPPIAPPPGAYPGTSAAIGGGAWSGNTATWVHDPTAVLGRRYGAFFIDVAISLAVFSIIFFALATQRTVAETLQLPDCQYRTQGSTSNRVRCDDRLIFQTGNDVYDADTLPTVALDVLFTFLYFGILEGVMGGTLGKRATGIRVVKTDGSIQGVPKSLVRWIVFAVDGPLSLFLCGIIASATSRGHRRLGDMSADTYVVAKEAVGHPIEVGLPPRR